MTSFYSTLSYNLYISLVCEGAWAKEGLCYPFYLEKTMFFLVFLSLVEVIIIFLLFFSPPPVLLLLPLFISGLIITLEYTVTYLEPWPTTAAAGPLIITRATTMGDRAEELWRSWANIYYDVASAKLLQMFSNLFYYPLLFNVSLLLLLLMIRPTSRQ